MTQYLSSCSDATTFGGVWSICADASDVTRAPTAINAVRDIGKPPSLEAPSLPRESIDGSKIAETLGDAVLADLEQPQRIRAAEPPRMIAGRHDDAILLGERAELEQTPDRLARRLPR